MSDRLRVILEHMLDDAQEAASFAESAGTFEAFCGNALLRKGVTMSLLNIGELARRLPDDFKDSHKEIPWKEMVGMRNLAAHGYHIMSDCVIWDTVKSSMPGLIQFLHSVL
jgi:uncharacterized protein with HEPN domain